MNERTYKTYFGPSGDYFGVFKHDGQRIRSITSVDCQPTILCLDDFTDN